MGKNNGGGKNRGRPPPRKPYMTGGALVRRKQLEELQGQVVDIKRQIAESQAGSTALAIPQPNVAGLLAAVAAPMSPTALAADPAELQTQQLVAYYEALQFTCQLILSVMARNGAAGGLAAYAITLTRLSFAVFDLIEGRQPADLKPAQGKRGVPPTQIYEWMPRVQIALHVVRTRRVRLASGGILDENVEHADYEEYLGRLAASLEKQYGLSLEDVIPGDNDFPENRPHVDQRNRADQQPSDEVISRVAARCMLHREDLQQTRGKDRKPPPETVLRHWEAGIGEIDHAEHAGTLSEPSDVEIDVVATLLRMVFDRGDHERRIRRIAEQAQAAPHAVA